jgi:hypothetical protein
MHAVHVPQLIFQLNIVSNEITRFNRIISSDVKRRGSVFFKIRLHQAQERCDNEVHISRAFNCRFFCLSKSNIFWIFTLMIVARDSAAEQNVGAR